MSEGSHEGRGRGKGKPNERPAEGRDSPPRARARGVAPWLRPGGGRVSVSLRPESWKRLNELAVANGLTLYRTATRIMERALATP